MTVLFLFGAGASFGNPDCSPKPPPLGKDLFDELRSRGGIAATVDDDLHNLFVKDFEAGMAEFSATRNVDNTEFLRDMAAYFVTFTPGPKNYYKQLVEIIARKKQRAVHALEFVILGSKKAWFSSDRKLPLDEASRCKLDKFCTGPLDQA